MGRKTANVITGIIMEQETAQIQKQAYESEHEHTPLRRDRELKTKRMNLLLPPSLAAWFKSVAYEQGFSINDAAIEAFKAWGRGMGTPYEGSK